MAEINITIKNLPQIRAAFRKAPSLMTTELNKAIRKTVIEVQRKSFVEYKSLGIRVITRGLWRSMQSGTHFGNLRGEVGPNVTDSPGVSYAGYVHSGTRYMRARPFLLNAVNRSDKDIDKYFTEAVDNVLNQIGRAT